MRRIVVLGYIVRGPLGGMSWHHLQYVAGLHRMGHDVYFMEDSDDYPSCYDPLRYVVDTDPSYGLVYAAKIFDRLELGDRWAYFDAHSNRWFGPAGERAVSICRSADTLINVSGINPLREWHDAIAQRLFVDTDPLFTQVRHLTKPEARAAAALHTDFCSFGENIGQPDCSVPDDGFPWRPTRQPVVLDCWPVAPEMAGAAYTTVMQWDSYPGCEYDGRNYGMKSASFSPYAGLPRAADERFEIALGGATAPRQELDEQGWIVRDPFEVSSDPWVYQDYLRSSKAEFTVAKHGYVASGSGWFSERSAVYLASGRPVVTQDTGFSRWLPCGRGVFAFDTPQEASEAIRAVGLDYKAHCRAAREIVNEFFESKAILRSLLNPEK